MSGEYESKSIRSAIKLAQINGNEIIDEDYEWSDARVIIFMKFEMPDELKKEIEEKFPNLDYWYSEETPHNPAAQGFSSRREYAKHKEIILFPVGERRWI